MTFGIFPPWSGTPVPAMKVLVLIPGPPCTLSRKETTYMFFRSYFSFLSWAPGKWHFLGPLQSDSTTWLDSAQQSGLANKTVSLRPAALSPLSAATVEGASWEGGASRVVPWNPESACGGALPWRGPCDPWALCKKQTFVVLIHWDQGLSLRSDIFWQLWKILSQWLFK